MNTPTRLVISSFGLAAALGLGTAAQAAPAFVPHSGPEAAPASVASATAATHARHAGAHRHLTAAVTSVGMLDRINASVAAGRSAEQQRWIARGVRNGRLTLAQAAQLERTQAELLRTEAALERRGYETLDEALQMQHRQDVQDWAIRTGHTA